MSLESLVYNDREQRGHQSIMVDQVLALLKPTEKGRGAIYIDATAGGGGHALALASRLTEQDRLICIDLDPQAVDRTARKLSTLVNGPVVEAMCGSLGTLALATLVGKVSGIFFDLGLSSLQLDDAPRGFSFDRPGPLDMRFNQSTDSPTAADILANANQETLFSIFRDLADEPQAARLARRIVLQRQTKTIDTTEDFRNLLIDTLRPQSHKQKMAILARNFQALRMQVNEERPLLEQALDISVDLLEPGGRLVLLAFHSGEDRIIKHFFRQASVGCVCPADVPICVCNQRPRLKVLSKRPLYPDTEELADNSRARSARLRAAEKIG